VKEQLTAEGITVQSFNADLLYEPCEVLDDDGCPFTMFAPFWNRCLCMPDPAAPLLPPKRINSGIQTHNLQSSDAHTVGDPVLEDQSLT
jgi:cryptochrome 1